MDWDDVRYFLAVSRRGSHKAAARQLGVDPTTISRRLASLESTLGAKLFARTPESLEPTPAGLTLKAHAERVEAEMLAAERALEANDTRVEGTLSVTAPDGFIYYVLVPVIAELRRLHPALTLELRGETRVLDLTRREADVAFRFGKPTEASLVVRKLGTVEYGLYAADRYLEARGNPRSLASLATHDWIGFDASLDDVSQVRWVRRIVKEPRYVVRTNSTTSQVLACADGQGVALFPAYVAAREPGLRRLLPRLLGPSRDLYFVTHEDLRTNARVVAFQSFVAGVVAAGT